MATMQRRQQMEILHLSRNPPLDGNLMHHRMEMPNLQGEEIMGEVQRLVVQRLTIVKPATSGLHPAAILNVTTIRHFTRMPLKPPVGIPRLLVMDAGRPHHPVGALAHPPSTVQLDRTRKLWMRCQFQDHLLTAVLKLFHLRQAIIIRRHNNRLHLSFINNNFNPALHHFNL
jgi:hypothetical protein